MINEQLENAKGFQTRVDYVCAALEPEKRPLVHYLGGNMVSGDPFTRHINKAGEEVVDVDTSSLINELEAHAAKYKGPSKELCAHFVLSLATGENLGAKDLLECARHYMKSMGYGRGSKWFSVVHYDTDNTHVHIVACRAQMIHGDMSPDGRPRPPQFAVVKDSNSYQKGWEACRELEKKFNLQEVPNPDECFAKNGDIFRSATNQEKVLRGIIGDVWKEGVPKTFSELVNRLYKRGVCVKGITKTYDANKIKGIAFKLDKEDGRWTSGSSLKAKYSFNNLILKSGIDFDPARDNAALGLSANAYTELASPKASSSDTYVVNSCSTLVRTYVKTSQKSQRVSSYIKNKGRSYGFFEDKSGMYLGFNARINLKFRKKTREEVEAEIRAEMVVKLMRALMQMMTSALAQLFHDAQVLVEICDSEDGLTEPALRLNVPVVVDADTLYDQHEEMELATDAQIEKQMSHLASVLEQSREQALLI